MLTHTRTENIPTIIPLIRSQEIYGCALDIYAINQVAPVTIKLVVTMEIILSPKPFELGSDRGLKNIFRTSKYDCALPGADEFITITVHIKRTSPSTIINVYNTGLIIFQLIYPSTT